MNWEKKESHQRINMFQYLHWPKDWGTEIAFQVTRAQFQVLFIIDGKSFNQIEAELFRFQNRGGHVELIACLYAWEKNIKCINALKRLANAGGVIGLITLSELSTPPANTVIIDKCRLISESELKSSEHVGELIFDQEKAWKHLFERAEPFRPSESEVQLHFQAQPSYVEPGGTIKLYWEVHHGDFAEIEPGIGAVPLAGQMEVPVFEDTLFRLKGGNIASTRSKSVFIKTAQQKHIVLSVSVLDVVSKAYIPLESTHEQGNVYAVFVGDRIKIDWTSLPIGLLTEARMGDIANESSICVEVFSDEEFVFVLRTVQEDFVERLQILAVSAVDMGKQIQEQVLTASVEASEIKVAETLKTAGVLIPVLRKIINFFKIWK